MRALGVFFLALLLFAVVGLCADAKPAAGKKSADDLGPRRVEIRIVKWKGTRPSNWDEQLEALLAVFEGDRILAKQLGSLDPEALYCDYSIVECDDKGSVRALTLQDFNGALNPKTFPKTMDSLTLIRSTLKKPLDFTGVDGLSLKTVHLHGVEFTTGAGNNVQLSTSTTSFSCSGCGIRDPSLIKMPSVLELDLSLNPLRNADLSQLPKHLTLLNLSHCDLQVENLEKLLLKLPSSLATLDLSSNQIGGTIPDFSQLFPVLSHFDVGNNSVQGSFSPAVFPPSIQVLNLGANQLKGAVNELSALVELQVLNLSHNQFVSLDTKELPNLLELDISHNAMEDLDLMRIMKLRDLTTFAASHNKLKGTIDLTMIPTGLQVLDLSDNQLSGTLDFTHFTDAIRFVFLHNNHFTGSLDLMDLPVDLRRLTFWGNDFPLELPPDPSGAKTPEL